MRIHDVFSYISLRECLEPRMYLKNNEFSLSQEKYTINCSLSASKMKIQYNLCAPFPDTEVRIQQKGQALRNTSKITLLIESFGARQKRLKSSLRISQASSSLEGGVGGKLTVWDVC